jgi:hypothetical protein
MPAAPTRIPSVLAALARHLLRTQPTNCSNHLPRMRLLFRQPNLLQRLPIHHQPTFPIIPNLAVVSSTVSTSTLPTTCQPPPRHTIPTATLGRTKLPTRSFSPPCRYPPFQTVLFTSNAAHVSSDFATTTGRPFGSRTLSPSLTGAPTFSSPTTSTSLLTLSTSNRSQSQ